MDIRRLDAQDQAALERFVAQIPEGDRTFFKEDVSDPEVVAAWLHRGATRSIAVDDGVVVGYLAVIPLQGWSSHVGEVRVIVAPDHRGRGIGRALAQHAVLEALSIGLRKVVVEVVADHGPTIAMFGSLGFEPEALLADHVRDQAGELRDLMVLAHSVDESFAALSAVGLADAL
jgi:L-amino acid N-acyltransferase YncA